jgi:hypothetical protein
MINRVPAGQSEVSARSVSSATWAPSRTSPFWRRTAAQRAVPVFGEGGAHDEDVAVPDVADRDDPW